MPFSRRDFLKLTGAAAGALSLQPLTQTLALPEPQFPTAPRLGRLVATLGYRPEPNANRPETEKVFEDGVVEILRETTASFKDNNVINQRWYETPKGYLYGAYVQPVRNLPNEPLQAMPQGLNGFWAEVTIPYADMILEGAPASPWAKGMQESQRSPRIYYSQVVWIDQIKVENGQVFYRFQENGGRPAGVTGGSFGDVFWIPGSALRPLTAEELAPISPDVDPALKKVFVNLTYQTVSCREGDREVYFCRCSTGGKFDVNGNAVDTWATPLGEHTTWRKAISIHMTGGSTGAGYDTPAVSWTTLFAGTGVAIHAAFWHNDFGQARSHGCVNVTPEDAKWIFRWTTPHVSLSQGDATVEGINSGSSRIVIEERTF